jgi:ribonuclease HIII
MAPTSLSRYTCKLDEAQLQKLGTHCEERSWESYSVPHARFAYRGPHCNVVAYSSGTVVVQGRQVEDFVQNTMEPEIEGKASLGYAEVNHPEWFEDHGGMDESGKGALFVPLVYACVIGGRDQVNAWLKAGVRDCKTIGSNAKIFALEYLIRHTPGTVVESFLLSMRKYNELYGGFGENLNRLLAWYHSKSLSNALLRKPVARVLLDQFSKQPLVQQFFRNQSVQIAMRPRAEEDPIVAAASIVARAEFLRALKALSENAGETLLRGASNDVLEQAKDLVKKVGADHFGNFAKLHFSTAQRALFS